MWLEVVTVLGLFHESKLVSMTARRAGSHEIELFSAGGRIYVGWISGDCGYLMPVISYPTADGVHSFRVADDSRAGVQLLSKNP